MSVPALERPQRLSSAPDPHPQGSPGGQADSGDLFNYAMIRRQLGFVGRSVRRHRTLAIAVFVAVTAFTLFLTAVMPRSYHVQTRILAQRNQVMASLGNPHRAVPMEADAPTRAATETVMRRDNLVAMVKQTNLVDNWEATRMPLLRVKDKLSNLVRGKQSEGDKMDALVTLLERRLTVSTQEGVITLAVDWNTGPMAYQLVDVAQQNFLESRHVSEVSAIEEAISILEAHAENVHESILRSLEEIQKLQTQEAKGQAPAPVAARPAPRRPPSGLSGLGEAAPEEDLNSIKFMLRAKRRAIQDLEDSRTKHLTELQNTLNEQKVIYSDQHPVVLEMQQRIAALGQESPQVSALKQDVEELTQEYKRKGGQNADSLAEPARPRDNGVTHTEGTLSISSRPLEDSPQLSYAREQLRIASSTYQDILMRIDAARIELDTSRAAFKYRYSVVNPAQMPKKPEKPNVPMMVLAGLLAALGLAIAAAVSADLRHGRYIESWQVESGLGLAVLGEVELP